MKFSATLSPKANKIQKTLEQVTKETNDALLKGVAEATLALHAQAVRGVAEQSAGEQQVRYNPKRTVVASKPGQPPNIDMGVFIRSIQFELDAVKMAGYVGSNDKRAPWFEFGTKNMKPRPWLSRALKKAGPVMQQIFRTMTINIDKAKR